MPEHAARQIGRHRVGALRGEPARAGRLSAADLEDPLAADFTQKRDVGLSDALRAPDEVRIAEEAAVGRLVVVGVGVPPRQVGGGGLRRRDRPIGDPRGAEPLLGLCVPFGLGDGLLAQTDILSPGQGFAGQFIRPP